MFNILHGWAKICKQLVVIDKLEDNKRQLVLLLDNFEDDEIFMPVEVDGELLFKIVKENGKLLSVPLLRWIAS